MIKRLLEKQPTKKAVFGFDAFIDQISCGANGLGEGPIVSMTDLGQRLTARGNKSGTVFLHNMQECIGGNAPNTALTLSSLGADVTCICALGYPRVRDVFLPLQQRCRVISYSDPGVCMAVELGQSKLFIGTSGRMNEVTWEEFVSCIGREQLLAEYARADLFGLFNWGELEATQRIWDGLLEEIFPALPKRARDLFFDFSDFSARSAQDLQRLKNTLKRFRAYGKVYVSANQLETELLNAAEMIENGVVDVFITHGKHGSAVMNAQGRTEQPTRFNPAPKRITGGGDCFNAGFCCGLLCGLADEDCLQTGNAAAGYLIGTGKVPDLSALCAELEKV